MEILYLSNNVHKVSKGSVVGILTGRMRNTFDGCSMGWEGTLTLY